MKDIYFNKENYSHYAKRPLLEGMKNSIGHHSLDQLILRNTWNRIVNEESISSRIDHIYTNCNDQIQRLQFSNGAYSDHLLIMFHLKTTEETNANKTIFRRSWYGYKKEQLHEELSKVDWTCDRSDSQSYYNWFENELLKVIDEIVPYKGRRY